MSGERWVLVAIGAADLLAPVKRAIAREGYRSTVVSSLAEFEEVTTRRTFLCAFFDPPFFSSLGRKSLFQIPTYTALAAPPESVKSAVGLQREGRIHDWLSGPMIEEQVQATLLRARDYLQMAGEVEAAASIRTRAVVEDSELLCVGSWEKTVNPWIERMKNGSSPLALSGEAGTGKRLLAQLIHCSSSRAGLPFVTIPCGGRNERDLEREIFGEIPPRGRSVRTPPIRGALARAGSGTVLFDEIEMLPRRLQQRVARAASTRSFSPMGGGDLVKTASRQIFAIQEAGRPLQSDLSRLLRNSTLRVPPLRERKEDFPAILRKILERLSREFSVRSHGITEEAVDLLREHHWPGNIRELEGVIWAANVLAGSAKISGRTLAPFLLGTDRVIEKEEEALEDLVENRLGALFRKFGVEHLKDLHPMILTRVERPLFSLVLRHTKGNQLRAAQILGINRNTLRKKLNEYGVTPAPPSQAKLL